MNAEQAQHLFRRQVAHLRRAWMHRVFGLRIREGNAYCVVTGLRSFDEGEQIFSHLQHLGFTAAATPRRCFAGGERRVVIRLSA